VAILSVLEPRLKRVKSCSTMFHRMPGFVVSKAILLHLEPYVLAQGSKKSFLSSTRTAHPFYLAVGYEDAGEPEVWAGMSARPMVKWLSLERGVQ
jgi:hypothetical protein